MGPKFDTRLFCISFSCCSKASCPPSCSLPSRVMEPQSPVQDPKGSFSHFLATRRTDGVGGLNKSARNWTGATHAAQSVALEIGDGGGKSKPTAAQMPKMSRTYIAEYPNIFRLFCTKIQLNLPYNCIIIKFNSLIANLHVLDPLQWDLKKFRATGNSNDACERRWWLQVH